MNYILGIVTLFCFAISIAGIIVNYYEQKYIGAIINALTAGVCFASLIVIIIK